MNSSRLVVISGPSGVGKGTVLRAVQRVRPNWWVSVSCTTRLPRPGEINGREYYFVDPGEFLARVDRGDMLEWTGFAGNLYGTPRSAVEQKLLDGQSVLLEIDLDGARQIRRRFDEAFLVFLAPPTSMELERRLLLRGTESVDDIALRSEQAQVELASAAEFDVVVINDDIGRAASEVVSLVESVLHQ